MKKYVYVFFCFLIMGAYFFLCLFFGPEFHFLVDYDPSPLLENHGFLFGYFVSTIAMCFIFCIFLGVCLVWDFFKSKSSGKEPDKNKNENN